MTSSRDTSQIILDMTDVVQFFGNATAVTGIQRVVTQLSLPLFEAGAEATLFDSVRGEWMSVDAAALSRLFELSKVAATSSCAWTEALQHLQQKIGEGKSTQFPIGSTLVSLGANWNQTLMFPTIRQLQAARGVVHACFIHDVVPFLFPELCGPSTVEPFRRWLASVVEGADVLITSAESTARDLDAVCAAIASDGDTFDKGTDTIIRRSATSAGWWTSSPPSPACPPPASPTRTPASS